MFMRDFKANDYAWKKISKTETHFNKMQKFSHVIERVNQFGSKMSIIKENIVN